MGRKKTNAVQTKRHQALRSAGRILDPQIVQDISDAMQLASKQRDQLSALERVQLANARLQMQAHPLAFRQAAEEPWPTAPTKELQAKHKFEKRAELGGVYSHRVKRVFENLSRHYPDAVLLALSKFYTDAESATICNVTVNYNGSGGGSPNGKIGGLGNVQERIRLQYARHNRIVETLRSIDEEHVEVLRWLVTEVRRHSDERMPDVSEVGRRLVPTIVDRATSRGISIGYLKAVAQLLIRLYRNDRLEHGDEYRRNRDEFEDLEA